MSGPKSFEISKHMVLEAYRRVKANKGAAGVDGQSIEQFEQDLKGNLYKLWNRMSSGCYFPPPVRMVEIPKPGGNGVRVLGVPSVADRVAQTVAAMVLEPGVEKIFHPDSYGYRPRKSALDAVGVCRERCWRADWVIDLDIEGFFDNLDHELVLKAVAHHTGHKWILLYVERWLKAPLQKPDGTLVARDRGSPQGSAISPLLANLFMHYAFDVWMAREFPGVAFERYCDDVVVHCRSEAEAHQVRQAIAERLAECGGLRLHPGKTRIVYCKDGKRRGSYEHTSFTFLGYGFRVRRVRAKTGAYFFSFNPAISDEAAKRIRAQIRAWRLHLRSGAGLKDLAREINAVVRGWINYYGRYYRSALVPSLNRINDYLVRWIVQKYKRYRGRWMRARDALGRAATLYPGLFAHWHFVKP
ncbi:group II intron reverse transcriptase/maturase [Microtetraspora sp. NBRC 16547]|uniref:group II intron reverse transcriptase/maturase n=1 Tax=Microtetraspora sp. NBRC 16547 TaxID=3030993 RepID=UPI0024A0325C|nr:group II intron reverse transcriptase/maturase [Microtetraspora sp. NBRC 16547]GLW98835.1 group II intron reverse transcriptase/maturase [Microtetraspora sp. NBRC 16547]